ncbi:MAG TPA: hypothetical protein VHT74_35220, partial [Acetobacteraceae bacterium]|nr:hypothetical protein [Acetobacteraceae bacterium]
MKLDFAREMARRAGGDWTPDKTAERFPTVHTVKTPEATPQRITVPALVAAWAAETRADGKALYDRERTAKLLTDFVGHDDVARITADDVVRWKEVRLGLGRSPKTVANDIGELRPIWSWGKANRKLSFVENPFAGLAPRSRKRSRGPRGPYTDDEASKLLVAAPAEKSASLRWLPWVLCFSGARL